MYVSTIKPSSDYASSSFISFVFGSSSLSASNFDGILNDSTTRSETCIEDFICSDNDKARLESGTASPDLYFNGASYSPTILWLYA